jgi:hypothetical protein
MASLVNVLESRNPEIAGVHQPQPLELIMTVRYAIALLTLAAPLSAQSAGGLHFTGFRSPATGFELRGAHLGVHAGYYPTVLKADGQAEVQNTNFIRIGAAGYLRQDGTTPYLSTALLVSLDSDWKNSLLSELGVRIPLKPRFALRVGVGVLTSSDGEVRVNPTVGFDIPLGHR